MTKAQLAKKKQIAKNKDVGFAPVFIGRAAHNMVIEHPADQLQVSQMGAAVTLHARHNGVFVAFTDGPGLGQTGSLISFAKFHSTIRKLVRKEWGKHRRNP